MLMSVWENYAMKMALPLTFSGADPSWFSLRFHLVWRYAAAEKYGSAALGVGKELGALGQFLSM